MPESTTRTEEHVLTSDLWLAGESMELTTPEEEVVAHHGRDARKHLCGRVDALMLEPLILALSAEEVVSVVPG
jgi:hypothetical protein